MKSISEPLKVILNNLEDKSIPYDQVRGIETVFKALDGMLYGMKNGDLIVIGSRPAMGKTSFVLQVAYHITI